MHKIASTPNPLPCSSSGTSAAANQSLEIIENTTVDDDTLQSILKASRRADQYLIIGPTVLSIAGALAALFATIGGAIPLWAGALLTYSLCAVYIITTGVGYRVSRRALLLECESLGMSPKSAKRLIKQLRRWNRGLRGVGLSQKKTDADRACFVLGKSSTKTAKGLPSL